MEKQKSTFEKTVMIINELGLHARPAAMIVKNASQFKSDIYISKHSDGETVNGKSIMGVMMLAASKGTKLTLRAEGSDCQQAIETLEKIINDKFGEE